MLDKLFIIQENISSLEWNIREDKLYLEEQKLLLQTEFYKTNLYNKYKSLYKDVKLEYIDEEILILICDSERIELDFSLL